MTRKRFVKLLMGKGWQRNQATAAAEWVVVAGSYEELYKIAQWGYTVLEKWKEEFLNGIILAVNSIAERVKEIAECFGRAFAAAADAIGGVLNAYRQRWSESETAQGGDCAAPCPRLAEGGEGR